MILLTILLFSTILPSASVREIPVTEAPHVLSTCEAAHEQLKNNIGTRIFFRLHGHVVARLENNDFILKDASATAFVVCSCDTAFRRGDIITATCTALQHTARPILYAEALAITVEGHAEMPPTPDVTPAELLAGEYNFKNVVVSGIMTEIATDETDPSWRILTIESCGACTFVWCHVRDNDDSALRGLVDAAVSIPGVCLPFSNATRRFMGPSVQTDSPQNITVTRAPPANPFEAGARFGHRQVIRGTLLASWGPCLAFLETDDGERIEVRFAEDQSVPPPGVRVSVSGFVHSNAFYKRFSNALVREEPDPPRFLRTPIDVSARTILHDEVGRLKIDTTMHGRIVRMRGRVRDTHLLGTARAQMLIECDGEPVTVWIGKQTTTPEPGAVVEVTGGCVMTSDSNDWTDGAMHISGLSIALRTPEELVVTASPPWWTPFRMLLISSVLVCLIVAILIWNASLRLLVERRGREMLRASIGRAEADLRTQERTRLAIELHDTIAQNLTGVGFELSTAERLVDVAADKALERLRAAERTLQSTRDQLRNCIWDLRSRALEQPSVEEAIRQSVLPHIGEARLSIRFNIPRTRLSDNTFHAILCIIRELSINATRHGGARNIRIAGSIEPDQLRFSVRDDGCGFDAEHAPGIDEGHFGLQGIRERIGRLGGRMTLDGVIGQGTKASVSIPIPNAFHDKGKGQENDHDTGR